MLRSSVRRCDGSLGLSPATLAPNRDSSITGGPKSPGSETPQDATRRSRDVSTRRGVRHFACRRGHGRLDLFVFVSASVCVHVNHSPPLGTMFACACMDVCMLGVCVGVCAHVFARVCLRCVCVCAPSVCVCVCECASVVWSTVHVRVCLCVYTSRVHHMCLCVYMCVCVCQVGGWLVAALSSQVDEHTLSRNRRKPRCRLKTNHQCNVCLGRSCIGRDTKRPFAPLSAVTCLRAPPSVLHVYVVTMEQSRVRSRSPRRGTSPSTSSPSIVGPIAAEVEWLGSTWRVADCGACDGVAWWTLVSSQDPTVLVEVEIRSGPFTSQASSR